MRIKIFCISLFLTCLSAYVFAAIYEKDEICRYWVDNNSLKFSRSLDQGKTFTQPQKLYDFEYPVLSFDVKNSNNAHYLVFQNKNGIFYAFSRDNGKSFAAPLQLCDRGKQPAIAQKDQEIIVAWADADKISYRRAKTASNLFDPAQTLIITEEVLGQPQLVFDQTFACHLVFLGFDPKQKTTHLLYTSIPLNSTAFPGIKEIYSSIDEIKQVQPKLYPAGLFLSWQSGLSDKLESKYTFLFPRCPQFSVSDYDPKTYDFLPAPEIVFPLNGKSYNFSNLKFSYRPSQNVAFPIIYKLEISSSRDFPIDNTFFFEQLCTQASQEMSLPLSINDGDYYARACFSNGIVNSAYSLPLSFILDNEPPKITGLLVKRKLQHLSFTGKISKSGSNLSINQQAIPINSSSFEASFEINAGKNHFDILSQDLAGNVSLVSYEVFYNCSSPEIEVLSPQPDQWFKSDQNLMLETNVFDLEKDLADDCPILLKINQKTVEHNLFYDPETNKISGFISLPPDMKEGQNPAQLTLTDKAGNTGSASFYINIDNRAPVVMHDKDHPFFINAASIGTMEISEMGAGLDAPGTIINIQGLSLETSADDNHCLCIKLNNPANQGSYEANITARDMVGNLAEPKPFYLIIDTTPPQIAFNNTIEAYTKEEKMNVQGRIIDLYPKTITITNNHSMEKKYLVQKDAFNIDIPLSKGNNQIEIIANDAAGNTTSYVYNIFADIAASSVLITDLSNGPNPFSSKRDSEMIFKLSLSQASNLTFYVFNLTGRLLWKKQYSNAASGIFSWNGIDQFGEQLENGVFPYLVVAESQNVREIRRGNIIVVN